MKLTPDQLRQNAAAMLDFADGKPVQARSVHYPNQSWTTLTQTEPSWDFGINEYRPKPEPVTRPWSKPEDVPLNCWLMRVEGQHHAVVQVDPAGIRIGEGSWLAWGNLEFSKWRYSTDRKTWHPCTVTDQP